MKIIIDIPDDVYNDIKSGKNIIKTNIDLIGTPLPKGHGRLIDADVFISNHFGNVARLVDEAPTIIEADDDFEDAYEDYWGGEGDDEWREVK